MTLGRVEAQDGDRLAALDCIAIALRNYQDSGNVTVIPVPMANLAVLLDLLDLPHAAATLVGAAVTPMTLATIPELTTTMDRLRDTLGGEAYDASVCVGRSMTVAGAIGYAHDQIERARARLRPLR